MPRRILKATLAPTLLLMVACTPVALDEPPARSLGIRLWSGPAPIGDGTTELVRTELRVSLPPRASSTGAAIVICPGGGYIRHVLDREGYPIAEWLNAKGIAAILLEYRLPEGRPAVPLLDAQRAIRTIRTHAKEWGVDPGRVGILGFSAGGHVASTSGTHFDPGNPGAPDPVERESSRPDFMILVYPVVTMGEKGHALSRTKLLGPEPSPDLVRRYSNETQVTERTPPAFVTHAKDYEGVVPDNSRNFVGAMRAHGVPVEYLEFATGGHGFNGCKGPIWEEWKTRSLDWLASQNMLTESR